MGLESITLSKLNQTEKEKYHKTYLICGIGFPCSSVSKESACSAGDPGSIPGSGRSPGEGNGNPLQYPCLASLMDSRAWGAAVHGVKTGGLTLTYLYMESKKK